MRSHEHKTFAPDGLTVDHVEQLIAEAAYEWAQAPRPSAALLDGSAAMRAQRRLDRRAITAVVRALPVRCGERESWEAA